LTPKKPAKVGDSWEISKDLLVKGFSSEGIEIDPAGTKGTGKLVKTYDKGGKKFGAIELRLDLPIKSLGAKNPFTLKEGSALSITGTVDCCIDGTEPTESGQGKVTIKIAGSGMGADLSIDGTETFTDKTELLKK